MDKVELKLPSTLVFLAMKQGRTMELRLLIFNLATDTEDPILGFTSGWIRAFANEATLIRVISMRTGRFELPANTQVFSVGKEKGYSRLRRSREFYRVLLKILRDDQINACFSHMMPLFSVMGAPLLRARGIPLVTWYAHPSLTTTLKIAHHLSDRMVASVASAYPYHHNKLTVIGQGIDTDIFNPGSILPDEPPIILCAGRLSPVKDHPTLLEAAALLRKWHHKPFRVAIVGSPVGSEADAYVLRLRQQVATLGLGDIVSFIPPVPNIELPLWYQRCTVHVNLTPTGFGDKVAWEAMSCGRPCIAANMGFRDTLGIYSEQLLFQHQDAHALGQKLKWILDKPLDQTLHIGAYLRQRVIDAHGLSGLPRRLNTVISEITHKHGKQ